MRACQYFLALVLAVKLRVAAQTTVYPLELAVPTNPIVACQETVFTWAGGSPDYDFFYAPPGPNGPGNDQGLNEVKVGKVYGTAIQFRAPSPGGLQYRFRVHDMTGQDSTLWLDVVRNNFCGPSSSTASSTVTRTAETSVTSTTPPPPNTTMPAPYPTSSTSDSSAPYSEPSVSDPTPTPSSTQGTTTTKQTIILNPNPSGPTPNPNSPLPSGSDVSSENAPPGSGGSSEAADGNVSSGDTRGPHPTGTGGGTNPTQTASPLRNTEDEAKETVSMSPQARGAIIGTITGAFVLFIAFLCFRWRKRHQQKHRPVPILPRVGNSGDDLTTAVIPPYEYSPPMHTNEHYPTAGYGAMLTARQTPFSVLPNSKQAMAMGPPRPSTDFGSDASSVISAGTWRSSRDQTSQHGSVSAYPEDEMPPVPGHVPAATSSQGQYLRPAAPPSMPSPLSLQQLIGRELDNILSSPEAYSPDSPLYTPTSISARDHSIRFRMPNDEDQSSHSGGGVASSSKHPYALTEDTSSQRGERAIRSPELGFMESRGGTQRQRMPISRNEMEYLADLVAARITRDNNQRTEQTRSDTGRHGPPPSYV